MRNNLDFTDRTVLVTGGSQGIGLAIVHRLLTSGARVEIWARDAARLNEVGAALREFGGKVSGIVVDVRSAAQVSDAAVQMLKRYGRVDAVINNAGVFGPACSILALSVDEWDDIFRSNLTSQFLVSRSFIHHMIANKYGRIVNMSSVVGKDANPMAPAYSAAKAGVIRFTQALGRDLAKTGVTVNCVTPGPCKTAFFDSVREEVVQAMLAKAPMGRFVEKDEVAAMVCWLASEDCSYTTGACFDISGGRSG